MSIEDMSLEELRRNPLVVSQEYMDKLTPGKRIQAEAAIELGYMKIAEAKKEGASS